MNFFYLANSALFISWFAKLWLWTIWFFSLSLIFLFINLIAICSHSSCYGKLFLVLLALPGYDVLYEWFNILLFCELHCVLVPYLTFFLLIVSIKNFIFFKGPIMIIHWVYRRFGFLHFMFLILLFNLMDENVAIENLLFFGAAVSVHVEHEILCTFLLIIEEIVNLKWQVLLELFGSPNLIIVDYLLGHLVTEAILDLLKNKLSFERSGNPVCIFLLRVEVRAVYRYMTQLFANIAAYANYWIVTVSLDSILYIY